MKCKSGKVFLFFVISLLIIGNVMAAGLSVQLKRTNPGVAGERSAELIFDVVNTDLTHKIEGFLLCRSPDDAVISSSLGAASGSGAQYLSPLFTMDSGPAQKAMSLTIESDSEGDKRTGCIIKYIPYKETTTTAPQVTDISFEGTIDKNGKDVSGFIITLMKYTPAQATETDTDDENVTATEETMESVNIKVDTTEKNIEVGSSAEFNGLTIEVVSATEERADVKVTGKKNLETTGTISKQYLKLNGQYVMTATDSDYSELRLDKTVPFVKKATNPECPEGKTDCKASEVIDVGGFGIPIWAIVVVVLVVVLLVFYLLGKTSRKD